MKFFVESQVSGVRYKVMSYDPKTDNAVVEGDGLRLTMNLEPDLLLDYNFKLVTEDGSDAKLERLQAELQAGVSDPKTTG